MTTVMVWICIITFSTGYGGGSIPMTIDNLATQSDCQRIAGLVKKYVSQEAYCIEVSKVVTK